MNPEHEPSGRELHIDAVRRAAVEMGLLPASAAGAGAPVPAAAERPWPVVLLTALGAWLAAVPLLGVIGLLLGDVVRSGSAPYFVGAFMLVGAAVVLRARGVPLFAEQLAVPALLVGAGAIGFGLFRDFNNATAAAVLALLALATAFAVRGAWLRALLGAAAAVLFVLSMMPANWDVGTGESLQRFWLAWHAVLGAALAWFGFRFARRLRAAVEPVAAGWLVATLAGLAAWSGMTFLVGGNLGGGFFGWVAREVARQGQHAATFVLAMQAISAALALAAAAVAALAWSGLRHPALAGVAAAATALAAFMPSLGGVLLALALAGTQSRWRLAALAGAAAAWIVGAFYYALTWPLTTKAAVLAAASATLAALAWWAVPRGTPHIALATGREPLGVRRARWGIASSLAAALAVANVGIGQKEDLIATGQPVFVELAPVDPRSLMQGDFMQLNFRLPAELAMRERAPAARQRPKVVARRDARGVATLVRPDDGSALAVDELRIELTPKDGRWVLVTDAWFFAEGEATRWAGARYGEFRVGSDGRALLVDLRGPQLEALNAGRTAAVN